MYFAFWPGILELGGKKMHAFDGHGLIARVSFQNGHAVFKSRYVKTKVLACPALAVVQQLLRLKLPCCFIQAWSRQLLGWS